MPQFVSKGTDGLDSKRYGSSVLRAEHSEKSCKGVSCQLCNHRASVLKDILPGHTEAAITEKALEIMENTAKCINFYKKDDERRKIEARVKVQLSKIPTSTGGHKFELVTFSSTTYCKVCDKLICGLSNEGYRCEGCQFNVHYDCIEKCPECLQEIRKQRPGYQRNKKDENNKNLTYNLPQRAPTVAKEQIHSCVWFAGVMSRHTASEKLQDRPNGTFLVRESDNAKGKGSFVLSVIYQGKDKHIKIVCNHQCLYSLTATVQFKTIPELIEYYKRNTLGVSFPSLPTVLTESIPGRDVVIAMYDFNARNEKELSLKRDARVAVLKQEGNWWFGELDGNIGFFPKNYVVEVSTAS